MTHRPVQGKCGVFLADGAVGGYGQYPLPGALDAGMTKCSRWLPGHDQAGAENEGIPDPDELTTDIAALEIWVKSIRARR